MLFSQRYIRLLEDESFIVEFDDNTKLKLSGLLQYLDYEYRYHPYKDNPGWTETTLASLEVLNKYNELHLTESINTTLEQDEILKLSTIQILDILEIWSLEVGNAEFVNEINKFFTDRELAWRLCSDKIVKIDAKQFEQDLANKTLAIMEEIQKAIPIFQNPYKEYLIALEKYSIKDYSQAIMYANMSYESILKIILECEGNASELTSAYSSSKYVESLPQSIKKAAFNEKILSSLPFLRNKPAISHGAGAHDLEIPASLAKLAINLAATLNTYLIEEYSNHMQINEPKENVDSFSFDDVPF